MKVRVRSFSFVFLIIIGCFSGRELWGQYRITGKIVERHSGLPVEAIEVFCQLQDSLPPDPVSVTTDNAGIFVFTLDKGIYNFVAACAGIECWSNTIQVTGPMDLGVISVDTSVVELLDGVGFSERKQLVKIEQGKIIYTPPMQSAGNAFDILKTAPGVLVTDESIEIAGKGNAGIMINGRWERMPVNRVIEYLKSLPAEQVMTIEIIRNPYAESDAENRSGYINIVLKGIRERGIAGTGNIHTRNASLFSFGGGINLNGNTGHWQYSFNMSASRDNATTTGSNILHFPDKYWVDSSRQVSETTPFIVAGTATYSFNKKHSVGGSLYWSRQVSFSTENNPSQIYNSARTGLDSLLRTTAENPAFNNIGSANLNYTFSPDSSGKKIRIDFDHFDQRFDRKQDFINYEYDRGGVEKRPAERYESGNDQLMTITTANLAVTLPLPWVRLSFGGKVTAISNINKTSFYRRQEDAWVADTDRFDHFKYSETTGALYVKADKRIAKWSFMAGLRAENTRTLGISEVYNVENSNQYLKLFPSADISYEHTSGNVLNIGYARRIERPMFVQVNPFRWYHTRYAFTHGNPSLQPFFSHNMELNYMLKMKWNFNAGYSRINQMFSEIDFVDPVLHTRETMVDNILDLNIYNVQVSTSFNIRKRWLLYPQAGVSYTQIFSKVAYLQYSAGYFGYASLFQQIAVDKNRKLLLDLNTYYYAPRSYGVMQFKTLWAQGVTLTYALFDNKWQVSITASDIFRTGAMRYNSTVNETLRERFVYRDQQAIAFTVRYNFKQGRANTGSEKNRSNEEEMNRVGR